MAPDPHDKTRAGKRVTRRAILAGTAGALAAAAVPRAQTPAAPTRREVPDDPTKVQGRPGSEIGDRSPFEHPTRESFSRGWAASLSPLQDLEGIITPADLHFERHHAGIPAIDPARYTLLIHGMVERPTIFTLADLKRFPARSSLHFLECSGNGSRAYREAAFATEQSPQRIDGLTSTSEWVGVPLKTLFQEVGVLSGATWFLAEGSDAAVMTRSIPVSKGLDDALIAYGQNGEALRPGQGYPARLFLPGFEGSSNVKWIRRIEVGDQPFMTREETSKYTDPLPDGTSRLFSLVMDAKSIITFPAYPRRIPEPGWWVVSGIAWSGRGRITQVEVTTDAGRTWQRADLAEPVLPICHTRFRLPWRWDGRETVLMSRATDETGYVQPTRAELTAVRGPGTAYHFNNIRAWKVGSDGAVTSHLAD